MRKDKYRVIKVDKYAVWELIYEEVNEKIESYFNISDTTRVVNHHYIDWETGDYMCLISKLKKPNSMELDEGIDLAKLCENMEYTTDTLYKDDTLYKASRYVELTLDDIKEIQNGGNQIYVPNK